MPYDIRCDKIPFDVNSVDAIYSSHVIEHVEDKFIEIMFSECYRVLKEGSVLRVACPDAEFLYTMSKFKSDYWQWRANDWFKSDLYIESSPPRDVDFLVREIATSKLLGYKFSTNKNDYIQQFDSMPMNDFFEFLIAGLSFRREFPGDHINYWTFDKLSQFLLSSGFKNIIRSKYMGSCCCEMTIRCKFDLTYPRMSLYLEAIK
jgi:SAM-dependent methyltransferase